MADSDSPAIAATKVLQQCRRRPVRVSLFDPVYLDRVGRYPGILAQVQPHCLEVECLDNPPSAPAGTRATLEVIKDGQLLWCHTYLQQGQDDQPYTLWLTPPHLVQSAQRRNSPRIDTYVPVHLVLDGTTTAIQGVIIDIGTGGAAVQSAAALSEGQRVALVFALGSGMFFEDIQAVVLRATALRTGNYTAGLRFENLNPVQERLLTQWVGHHAQNAFSSGIWQWSQP